MPNDVNNQNSVVEIQRLNYNSISQILWDKKMIKLAGLGKGLTNVKIPHDA